ncbi:MAG TPA: excinuclease ABC subunit C, partial [Chitinophagaceae bacterium]|nr:excinuclease ABC subunit C [Chitinophagaceae bacterium]
VFRRYKRLKEENQSFPQLIIIDGGKGQLSAAEEAMNDLGEMGASTLIGLAKNEEEIFFPGDQQSLKLSYNSESLKLIRRIRNEVHRFGITFHRNKRSKGTFKNELEDIPGIGNATADLLLKTFKSVKNIREILQEEKGLAELEALIGRAKAGLISSYFKG